MSAPAPQAVPEKLNPFFALYRPDFEKILFGRADLFGRNAFLVSEEGTQQTYHDGKRIWVVPSVMGQKGLAGYFGVVSETVDIVMESYVYTPRRNHAFLDVEHKIEFCWPHPDNRNFASAYMWAENVAPGKYVLRGTTMGPDKTSIGAVRITYNDPITLGPGDDIAERAHKNLAKQMAKAFNVPQRNV
jgi:hypothetical protein